jgi:DNA-binding ferritin-like protein (Dps family)
MAFAWIEQKRHYRRYQARVAALPTPYRTAVSGMERYLNHLGGMGDASSIMRMLDDFADLVEQGAAAGTPVREIFGADPVEFATAFLSNYPSGRWITREQDRLRASVDAAEAQQR